MQQQHSPERKFVLGLLPWIIAAAAVLVYSLTLNSWLGLDVRGQMPFSSNSLETTARIAGWTWSPDLTQPLFWLVTYPFRWLPASAIPFALNLFAALCAALALAQLARSVAILPHDRTEEQRARERHPSALLSIPVSWVPPIVAALVCGFQLSFWEHATVASAEMFNLLLFAFIIRAVLEYRLDGRQFWLSTAALVYGAAMANNWAMIAFFPVFLFALVWIRGLAFFNKQFLLRMFVWGSIGLLFYLLLPLVNSFSDFGISFWQALKANLAMQKTMVLGFAWNKGIIFSGERPFWILAVPSLLPLIVMGIRWPSYFGDPSRLGVTLATLIFHFFHAFLLVVCLWVSFNPQFSPRVMVPGTPVLTFYYLSALSIGYLVGYFLLVFRPKLSARSRTALSYPTFVSVSVKGIVCLLTVATVAGLLYRNLPHIRNRNGPALREYAALVARSLPTDPTVVLSDDLPRLVLAQAIVAKPARTNLLFVHTGSLAIPEYHKHLSNHSRWPYLIPKGLKVLADGDKMAVISIMYATNQIYYLHPSFGYYFEVFAAEPHGLVYKLDHFPTNSLFPPPLLEKVVEENEKFWANLKQGALGPVLAASAPAKPARDLRGVDGLFEKLHLPLEPARDNAFLGTEYSRALNYWGVQVQRQGNLELAAAHFKTALQLNPENVMAEVNLESNRKQQAGIHGELEMPKSITDRFAKYRGWNQIISDNGPSDDANLCFAQGQEFVRFAEYRQAAQQFKRTLELAPTHLESRLRLAQIYVLGRLPEEALKILDNIRANGQSFGLSRTNAGEMMVVEASAHLLQNDAVAAEKVVNNTLSQYPDDEGLFTTASRLFMDYGAYTNSLKLLNSKLAVEPENRDALLNKGFVLLQMKAFDQAIAPLTKVINQETNTPAESALHWMATINRAIAYLQAEKLEESKQDYETLQEAVPNAFQVYYGLGEIAYRKRDTNSALKNYRLYLSTAPTNTAEAKTVITRLNEMGGGR